LTIEREVEIQSNNSTVASWLDPSGHPVILTIPPTVYPPREDSVLLDNMLAGLGPGTGKTLLEIGCGSGAISISAAKRGWSVSSCDINPFAVAATIGNAKDLGVVNSINVAEGGPGEEGDWWPEEGVDVIVWNLPYMDPPDTDKEGLGPLEDAAMIDSSCGAKLAAELVESPHILNPGGIILLLHSSNEVGRNLPPIWRRLGWSTRVQRSEVIGDEELTVIAVWRPYAMSPPILMDTCDSTNSEILDGDYQIGQLIQTYKQKSGRGRKNKLWESGKGSFLGSWSISSNSIEGSPGYFQMGASIAILDTFSSFLGFGLPSHSWANGSRLTELGVLLKWPNDIYLEMAKEYAKICGILVEGKTKAGNTRIAIGIGINSIGPNIGVNTAGWRDIPGLQNVKLERISEVLHASMSSVFEIHPLLENTAFDCILEGQYNALIPSFNAGGNQNIGAIIGISKNGHLLTVNGEINSLDELDWHWNC